MTPFFSIITVCYNSENTIERTFNSLLKQTFKNFEYIIVDGVSNDSTVTIIKRYERIFYNEGIEFYWISEPDTGIYNAMNKGIKMARGELIGIINSDDSYTINALDDIYSVCKRQPGYGIYHGLMRFWSGNNLVMIRALGNICLDRGMLEHPACFVRKTLYERIGLYNEKYKYVADYEFMLRAKSNSIGFYLVESIVSNFDENGAGNSFESRKELIKLKREYRLNSPLKLLIQYMKIIIRKLREQ